MTTKCFARRVVCALFSTAILCAGAALADQSDPRLPQLFSDLGDAPDPRHARNIEQQIWSIWFESPDSGAQETLNQARNAAQSGAVNQAMILFDQLVIDHPGYAEGWNQRAIMRYLTGDVSGSLADIERALALEPRHFGALSGRGQCYLRQDLYRDALNAFEDAISINPWINSTARQIEMLKAYIRQLQTPI